MKIDWKTKLCSRKFWAAIIGFVAPLLVAFGCSEQTVTQATAIIMAGGTLIAYIIGEGLVDASRVSESDPAGQLISIISPDDDEEEVNDNGDIQG